MTAFKVNPSSIAAQKVNMEGVTYRLINEETGEEHKIHIGPFPVEFDDKFRGVSVTLPLPAKTGTTTYTIEVKVSPYKPKLQEAATTPVQEPATYKFRDLQEASHATK